MSQRLTRAEFHQWAERQPHRHERIGGEVVAMAPERAVHARLKARIWRALDQAIRDNGLECEAFPDGMTVEIDEDTDYEPDAVVNCGPPVPPDSTVANNPVVVVEVMSPSTRSIDTGDKLADYFRHPSVRHYLIVRARRREIIHHWRDGPDIGTRTVASGPVRLDPPGLSIDVDEVYAGIG